jgi:tetratricopeptide (TPR) repeat protein
VLTDPVQRAETYSVLARAQASTGDHGEAIATVREALASAGLPLPWRARMLALLPMLEHANDGDLDLADATARQALTVADEAGDTFAAAHALTDLWLSHSIRRDHGAALGYIDRALLVLGDDPGYPDLRSYALEGPDLHPAEPGSLARSRAGPKPSWLCSRRVSSRSEAAALTARPGRPRRCCGTGSASGTMRWPS